MEMLEGAISGRGRRRGRYLVNPPQRPVQLVAGDLLKRGSGRIFYCGWCGITIPKMGFV